MTPPHSSGAFASSIETILARARDGTGLDVIAAFVRDGDTVAVVGASGVGKSAITNRLLGREAQREGEAREADDKGRHTTAHRELFVLEGGGCIIDTPGLR